MRGINPPVLFELRALSEQLSDERVDGHEKSPATRSAGPLNTRPSAINQTMAECRGLAPLARRHALVSTEARSACPVDIPNWSAWQDLHLQPFRFERNASSLGYTRWCSRADLH